jgi:hypothetical protein
MAAELTDAAFQCLRSGKWRRSESSRSEPWVDDLEASIIGLSQRWYHDVAQSPSIALNTSRGLP